MSVKFCRHCNEPLFYRIGRGLCRTCWNNKTIREIYPVISPFGGDTRAKQCEVTEIAQKDFDIEDKKNGSWLWVHAEMPLIMLGEDGAAIEVELDAEQALRLIEHLEMVVRRKP